MIPVINTLTDFLGGPTAEDEQAVHRRGIRRHVGLGREVMEPVTDIRQVSVNRVTIGVIISTAILAGSISWSSSRLVSRLDAVETSVEAIQEAMDRQPYARVEDVAEDIDELWLEVGTLGERLEELTDSVSFLLLLEDRGLPDRPAE